MAVDKSPTVGDILQIDPSNLKCLIKTKYKGEPQCRKILGKDNIVKARRILNMFVTCLVGDMEKVFAEVDQLPECLAHTDLHGEKEYAILVLKLEKEYRRKLEDYSGCQAQSVRGDALDESVQEREEHPTQEQSPACAPSSCIETTEVRLDFVDEPQYPSLQSSLIQSTSVPEPTESLPDALARPANPVSLTEPSHPLLSLFPSTLQRLLLQTFASMQFRTGHVQVKNASGKIEDKSVFDLKILFGLRIATNLIPAVLLVGLCGIVYQACTDFGFMLFSVFGFLAFLSWSRRIPAGSEIVV